MPPPRLRLRFAAPPPGVRRGEGGRGNRSPGSRLNGTECNDTGWS
jgi:hypothetical protein